MSRPGGTRTDRASRRHRVRLLVRVVGEEMKRGPVMPQRHGAREPNRPGLGANQRHAFGAIPQIYSELVEGRLGDVDRNDRRVIVIDELPDQRRRAATDDGHRVRAHRHAAHHLTSSHCGRPIPADRDASRPVQADSQCDCSFTSANLNGARCGIARDTRHSSSSVLRSFTITSGRRV